MADDNLTQMSLTMPASVTTEPDVTPAVRRAADVLFAAEVAGLILDDIRAALVTGLEGETIAETLGLHADLVWVEPAEVFECLGCDFCIPGDEVEARTLRWHQADMIRAAIVGES